MPFNLQIIRTSDFIRLNAKGEYDSAASRAVLSKLAKAIVDKGLDSALINVRDAHSDMQLHDVYELAMAFKEMGFQKKHRLAILYRSTAGEHLEFFAMRPGERAQFFAMCIRRGAECSSVRRLRRGHGMVRRCFTGGMKRRIRRDWLFQNRYEKSRPIRNSCAMSPSLPKAPHATM